MRKGEYTDKRVLDTIREFTQMFANRPDPDLTDIAGRIYRDGGKTLPDKGALVGRLLRLEEAGKLRRVKRGRLVYWHLITDADRSS